ncbi:hypothetical protein B6I21_03360 [candidate division KSB1 bacterium 4572_119]|nr:MAG: hypothetical protein B6I21_03360 [candidate division KSB1 bacterium 4572_119]
MKNQIKSILSLILLILVFACAKQMPPRGGPEDKTPPVIVNISPVPGATNVPTDTKIEITFSERMSSKTVEEAFFISPLPAEDIFFKWRNKKLRIEFSDTLKTNRTYVLTIGTKASDMRNNKLADSYSLAFSTGEKIDDGQISGTVYDPAGAEGTLVCAYQLINDIEPNPEEVFADYYTQCNQQGVYNLMYAAPGRYRLFAINDRDGDRKYTLGLDAVGVAGTEVLLSPENKSVSDICFQMSVEDTVLLFLKSAYSIDRSKIDIRFNEAVKKFNNDQPENYFRITAESDSSEFLEIINCYLDSRDLSVVHLITEDQSEIPYNIRVFNLFDRNGLGLDTTYDSIVFDGSAMPDTIKPSIVFQSLSDSTSDIKPDSAFQVIFSEAMNKISFENNFVFTNQNNDTIAGNFQWKNPTDVAFIPDSILSYKTGYQITIPVDSIKDSFGNSLKDSILSIYFETLSEDTLTSISGNIADEDTNGIGKIFLYAASNQNKYARIIDKPGSYLFDKIFPGIYTIYAFRDADSNGVYSYGKVQPYVPSERFVFYSDSIKVRSKWSSDGNDIILKSQNQINQYKN